jgi:diketogulonate reductase-like aldo/keto reductase
MILQETYTLSNGVSIPKVGLGTWLIPDDKVTEVVGKMAAAYGVTVPQLCIRYTLQLGAVSLPKSSDPGHIRSNASLDFVIKDEDMAFLKTVAG